MTTFVEGSQPSSIPSAQVVSNPDVQDFS